MTMENLPMKSDASLPFVIMDAMDDALIIAELEGRLPDILTYHFEGKNEKGEVTVIWGLSKIGVDEATSELAKGGEVIRELELIFMDGKDEGFFQVKSGRYAVMKDGTEVLLDTKIGAKRQTKKYKNGSDNPFWYEQGAMKAARNAAMRLIPANIKQGVIEYAKKAGRVKDVSGAVIELTEEAKMESGKRFANFHDNIIQCRDLSLLTTWWKNNNKTAKKELIPEHFQTLVELKDSLKIKLGPGEIKNE